MTDTYIQGKHDHVHSPNRFAVIPTSEKLSANERFSGKGIRIAFLDSGFFPHPDIIDRVAAFHDISGEDRSLNSILEPKAHHWHGTQTVVSCAGDGSLSGGFYKGLAHRAELVLVKVSEKGRIGDEQIEKGLEWMIANRERLGIRILNISLGGDLERPTSESKINQLTEKLVEAGVVVTVAAGNAETCTLPPASAPSAITVGGYSDENQFDASRFDLYHSAYGKTSDGNTKPELVAPAMYVAAPILPGTPDYTSAEILSMLSAAPDYSLPLLGQEFWADAGLEPSVLSSDPTVVRQTVENELKRRKIVATHYQHVDGTSFAAPIAASLVAQMLEANTELTPAAVKNILISTAEKIGNGPAIRQGFGIMNARAAVERSAKEDHSLEPSVFTAPQYAAGSVVFTFHDDNAKSVCLVGDMNGWNSKADKFEKMANGLWKLCLAIDADKRYRYKLVIDESRWSEDPSHEMKEDDGFGGFNSILET